MFVCVLPLGRANNQKDEFKRVGKKAKIWGKPVSTTKDGRLLTSGWWGAYTAAAAGTPRAFVFMPSHSHSPKL
jgi:hypothetical protein